MTNEELADKMDRNMREITTVKEILTGNGNPSRGLVVRFDRVEQSFLANKRFGFRMLLAGSAAVLSFFGSIALLVVRLTWGI
jgi:hypothetical protein